MTFIDLCERYGLDPDVVTSIVISDNPLHTPRLQFVITIEYPRDDLGLPPQFNTCIAKEAKRG